jgi:hypothetical protein
LSFTDHRLPISLVIRVLLLRATILWALVRLVFVAIGAFADDPRAVSPSPGGVVALCVALAMLDRYRRGESVLWANLGWTTAQFLSVFGAAAIGGETIWYLLA